MPTQKKPIGTIDLQDFFACAGPLPKELRNLTNLEHLYLHGNDALEKPPGCPVDGDGEMFYNSKDKIAAFLRCLA